LVLLKIKRDAAFNYKEAINNIFRHVIRQRELKITQRVITKKNENTRTIWQPRKRWIDGIIEMRRNLTAEEANMKAKDLDLSVSLTLRVKLGRDEQEVNTLSKKWR
jgi:hypothetical protein